MEPLATDLDIRVFAIEQAVKAGTHSDALVEVADSLFNYLKGDSK